MRARLRVHQLAGVLLAALSFACGERPPLPHDPQLALPPPLDEAFVDMPQPVGDSWLLPPIGGDADPRWLSLAMSLLRTRSELRLLDPEFRPASAAAFFGWVRQQEHGERTYWCVDLQQDGYELLAARGARQWRSGLMSPPWFVGSTALRPFRPADAIDRLRIDVAEGFLVDGSDIYVYDAERLRRIEEAEGRLRLGESRVWSDFDLSPLDRHGARVQPIDSVSYEFGARRFEFDSCTGSWWIDGARLAQIDAIAPLALSPWPRRPAHWLLLSSDGRELQWHRGPWRRVPERAASRRGELVLELASGSMLQRCFFWRDAHVHTALALRDWDQASARPLAPFRLRGRDRGRHWRIEGEGVDFEALERALSDRWQTLPAWLRADRELRGKRRRDALELELVPPLPDLLERLAHPLLWLSAPELPIRGGRPGVAMPVVGESGMSLPAEIDFSLPERRERGDRLEIALLPSALATRALRLRLRDALLGVEFFAGMAPAWQAKSPILREGLPSFRRGPAQTGNLYMHWELGTLPQQQRERVGNRLVALARGAGIAMQQVMDFEGLQLQPGDAVGRIARLPLFSAEPLLRAVELAAWMQRDFDVDPALWLQQPGSPDRVAAARAFEAELLREGWLIPLWTVPLDLSIPSGWATGGDRPVGMPPLIWDLHRRGCGP